MRIDIIMPKMGESVMEGTILKWHKQPGDKVKKDEILFEISTDKVDTEIPAQEDGVLTEILAPEGATLPVNSVVAKFDSADFHDTRENIAPESVLAAAIPPEPAVIQKSDEVSPGLSENLVDVQMPKMGESVMEGTVLRWLKRVGEKVKQDEILFEISTDKVDTEVPSPAAGVLNEILVREQETVPVGTIVARLSTGEMTSQVSRSQEPERPAVTFHDTIAMQSARVSEVPEPATASPIGTPGQSRAGDTFYSPLVMNIAHLEGVSTSELALIPGSGIGNRVTKKDILQYLADRKSGMNTHQSAVMKAIAAPAKPAEHVTFNGDIAEMPMDNIRQKIMQHMISSRNTSVHVAGVVEVDMSSVQRILTAHKERILNREGVKLTYTSFVAFAAVKALVEHPLVNSSIRDNSIIQKRAVNLGIAVALEPNGLIVPNVKNAHEKNLAGLARSISEIALKARSKKLSPDDISGGTFSITNYGVFGTLIGTPIINQPEVAILGMGAVIKRAVVVEHDGFDSIAIKPMMYLTLSHDHRLVDGMLGGKFLWSIKNHLEHFDEKLL